jgi:hypothetical protein
MNPSTINKIESSLGLAHDFFENLLLEDDWSFIIKIHALIEAVCTDLLLYHFKESNLVEPITFLDLSNQRYGKTVFLKKLELITSEHTKMINELGKIRNAFAHKISDLGKTFEEKLNEYDKNQVKNFHSAFPLEGAIAACLMREVHGLSSLPKLESSDCIKIIKSRNFDLKLQIWAAVFGFLIHTDEIKGFSDYRQWEKSKDL